MSTNETKYTDVFSYVMEHKYSQGNENWDDISERVARHLTGCEEKDAREFWRERFAMLIKSKIFIPGGRILANSGRPKSNMFNCLSGQTKILTKEYGLIEISQVCNQTVTLLDANRSWVKSTIRSFGHQKLIRLNFGNELKSSNVSFFVDATLDHDWVICGNKRIKTKALRRGHKVPLILPSRKINNQIQYRRGIQHGLIYGDGTKHTSGTTYQLRVCRDSKEILYFFQKSSICYPPSSQYNPTVSFSGRWDRKHWIRQHDLKRLPDPEIQSSDYIIGFFRGWFAADGCVDTRGYPTICVGPEEEEWIRLHMPKLGYFFGNSCNLESTTNFGRRKKESRNLFISRHCFRKEDCLLDKHKKRIRTPKEYIYFKGTKEINKNEEVFCANVPTTHSFVLDSGILTGNCFIRQIDDSLGGSSGWAKTFHDSILISGTGGGIGYDFSLVRPRGTKIQGVGGITYGAVALMDSLNALGHCISGGQGRGIAFLFGLPIWHGDIKEFVVAKTEHERLRYANVSVMIDDEKEFLKHLDDEEYELPLKHNGLTVGKIKLKEIVDLIIDNMIEHGEPGFINRDAMNRDNNHHYYASIDCTNPCGEVSHTGKYGGGICNLGSIDISQLITSKGEIDRGRLKSVISDAVRMLDNAYDCSIYPTSDIETLNKGLRRIGLGIMGLHHYLLKRGIKYSDLKKSIPATEEIMRLVCRSAYWASIELAEQKGPFSLYKPEFLESGFCKRALTDSLREEILAHGVRNATLISIAPTGTISRVAGCSPGLEPCLAKAAKIKYNFKEVPGKKSREYDECNYIDPVFLELLEAGKEKLFETADEIDLETHLAMQVAVQKYVDASVSKTINFEAGSLKRDDVKKLLKEYFPQLKGFTLMPIASSLRSGGTQVPVEEKEWRKWLEDKTYVSRYNGEDNSCKSGKCEI